MKTISSKPFPDTGQRLLLGQHADAPISFNESIESDSSEAGPLKRFNLFSIRITNCKLQQAIDSIVTHAMQGKPSNYAFINADCLNKAYHQPAYRAALARMQEIYPDGIGVKLAAKMQKVNVADNVNGTDLFPLLCQQAAEKGLKLYLLGARPGVAKECAEKMIARFPELFIAGVHHGYFDKTENDQIISQINKSAADIVIVAFGAPAQELWMDTHRSKIQAPVCIGVGGCLDFYADRIPRAPIWVRKMTMEWIWRLIQEPKRLWRRYILGNPLFLYRAWKWANQ